MYDEMASIRWILLLLLLFLFISLSYLANDCLDIGKQAWTMSSDVVCEWMEEAGRRTNDNTQNIIPDIVTNKVECLMQVHRVHLVKFVSNRR